MISQLIKKNNISIEGNSNGPAMIFGHGFGTDQTAWDGVKGAFAEDYKLILYDNAGAGKSDLAAFSPLRYHSIWNYADDLIEIAETFELEDAIMVAHSVSSMISLLAAIKAPQYFSKMVFIGASPRYLNDGDYHGGFSREELDRMFDTMRSNYHAWVSGFSAAAMANHEKPELGEGFARTLSAIRPDIALSVSRVIFESDVRSELGRLKKPVLLLQSQKDIAVPNEAANFLNEHIKESRLLTVNAEGHLPHISAPSEIIKAIKDFI